MSAQPERRYRISEVAELLDVPVHVLRQWEDRFTQLNPKRNAANRRYYSEADIDIARRIKQLIRHEKLTTKGASRRLSQEIFGVGRPQTKKEMLDLADRLQTEIREMLDILDKRRD